MNNTKQITQINQIKRIKTDIPINKLVCILCSQLIDKTIEKHNCEFRNTNKDLFRL